jgi:hypothetical protein
MNKTNLLLTSAMVVLMAGVGPSLAQQQSAPEREHAAPAEKMAPEKAPSHAAPAGTTGQASHEERQSQSGERKSAQEREKTEHPQNRPTSQTQREQRDHTTGQMRQEDRGSSQQNRADQGRERTDHREQSHETTGQGAAGARANIAPETRTRIHDVIVRERNAPRVVSPNFEVSVGTRVPATVQFVAVPQTVVDIEPEWRGFEYFLIGDEMVVVDPRTMEIVAIIDA